MCEFILFSSFSNSLRNLSKSSLNSFSDDSKEIKFLSSSTCGSVILIGNGSTKGAGIIK